MKCKVFVLWAAIFTVVGAIIGTPFVRPGTVQSAGEIQDVIPPQLAGLSFSPSTIDVSDSSQVVTFTLRLTDDLSGVHAASWGLSSPSNGQGLNPDLYSGDRISGTALDGVYQTR